MFPWLQDNLSRLAVRLGIQTPDDDSSAPYDDRLQRISGLSDRYKIQIQETHEAVFCAFELSPKAARILITPEFEHSDDGRTLIAMAYEFYPHVEIQHADSTAIRSEYGNELRGVDHAKEGSANKETFYNIVRTGLKLGAAEIRIAVTENSSAILFRIDRKIGPYRTMERQLGLDLISTAYNVLADKSSYQQGESNFDAQYAQSCLIHCDIDSERVSLRYNSIVTPVGPYVTLRVFRAKSKKLTWEGMGFLPEHIELFLERRFMQGLYILSGPTGSGKTTTHEIILNRAQDERGEMIVDLADPPEMDVYGVQHVPVDHCVRPDQRHRIEPFAAGIKHALRMGTDIVSVGEIRNYETAEQAKAAVLAGHPVIATLHTSGVNGVIPRLSDGEMRVPLSILTMHGHINFLSHQRLIPKLCPHCKAPAELDDQNRTRLTEIGLDPDTVMDAKGCDECRHTGRRGMITVAEILIPDLPYLALCAEKRFLEAEIYWRSTRTASLMEPGVVGKTVFEVGLYHVMQGDLSLRDLERRTNTSLVKSYMTISEVRAEQRKIDQLLHGRPEAVSPLHVQPPVQPASLTVIQPGNVDALNAPNAVNASTVATMVARGGHGNS